MNPNLWPDRMGAWPMIAVWYPNKIDDAINKAKHKVVYILKNSAKVQCARSIPLNTSHTQSKRKTGLKVALPFARWNLQHIVVFDVVHNHLICLEWSDDDARLNVFGGPNRLSRMHSRPIIPCMRLPLVREHFSFYQHILGGIQNLKKNHKLPGITPLFQFCFWLIRRPYIHL